MKICGIIRAMSEKLRDLEWWKNKRNPHFTRKPWNKQEIFLDYGIGTSKEARPSRIRADLE